MTTLLAAVWNDVKYACRSLRKAPMFSSVAILSLALGIGANTAIFSLVDQVLLRLLPVKNPEELTLFTMRGQHYGGNWGGNVVGYDAQVCRPTCPLQAVASEVLLNPQRAGPGSHACI